jgi:hypothetical protein
MVIICSRQHSGCFGYKLPNYDIKRLVEAVVNMVPGRQLATAHYYIGIPTRLDDPANNLWWTRKLAAMGRTGVKVETRPLKKRVLRIRLEGIANFDQTVPYLKEKGIVLKMGLDMVRMARSGSCDAVVLFSQDGDLVEALSLGPLRWLFLGQQAKRFMIHALDPTDYKL